MVFKEVFSFTCKFYGQKLVFVIHGLFEYPWLPINFPAVSCDDTLRGWSVMRVAQNLACSNVFYETQALASVEVRMTLSEGGRKGSTSRKGDHGPC